MTVTLIWGWDSAGCIKRDRGERGRREWGEVRSDKKFMFCSTNSQVFGVWCCVSPTHRCLMSNTIQSEGNLISSIAGWLHTLSARPLWYITVIKWNWIRSANLTFFNFSTGALGCQAGSSLCQCWCHCQPNQLGCEIYICARIARFELLPNLTQSAEISPKDFLQKWDLK